ncbi:hypothetical protein [Longitalea arenae]|uniref:hypothetical protein n=1 Tax=Longitalea arenae TaxID=2812558 RepID=UPI001967F608|nr:hypothetical protein [Longitalea arenae]
MKAFIALLLIVTGHVMAQEKEVAHFSYWKPKAGQEKNFEHGYKEHLKWHKENGDTWAWYGWYIISGERSGQFVDATFDHAWSDFDEPVKPAEDQADNRLHTYPFGDFMGGSKLLYLPALSIADSNSLQSKFLRLVSMNVSDGVAAKKVIGQLKNKYQSAGIRSFMTFRLVDGGNLNQYCLLIGLNNFAAFSRVEHLPEDVSSIEQAMKIRTIHSMTSETLVYRADMSLFP